MLISNSKVLLITISIFLTAVACFPENSSASSCASSVKEALLDEVTNNSVNKISKELIAQLNSDNFFIRLGIKNPTMTSDKEIKAAYRSLAQQIHPDRHDPANKELCDDLFKKLNNAYNALNTVDGRDSYLRKFPNHAYSTVKPNDVPGRTRAIDEQMVGTNLFDPRFYNSLTIGSQVKLLLKRREHVFSIENRRAWIEYMKQVRTFGGFEIFNSNELRTVERNIFASSNADNFFSFMQTSDDLYDATNRYFSEKYYYLDLDSAGKVSLETKKAAMVRSFLAFFNYKSPDMLAAKYLAFGHLGIDQFGGMLSDGRFYLREMGEKLQQLAGETPVDLLPNYIRTILDQKFFDNAHSSAAYSENEYALYAAAIDSVISSYFPSISNFTLSVEMQAINPRLFKIHEKYSKFWYAEMVQKKMEEELRTFFQAGALDRSRLDQWICTAFAIDNYVPYLSTENLQKQLARKMISSPEVLDDPIIQEMADKYPPFASWLHKLLVEL